MLTIRPDEAGDWIGRNGQQASSGGTDRLVVVVVIVVIIVVVVIIVIIVIIVIVVIVVIVVGVLISAQSIELFFEFVEHSMHVLYVRFEFAHPVFQSRWSLALALPFFPLPHHVPFPLPHHVPLAFFPLACVFFTDAALLLSHFEVVFDFPNGPLITSFSGFVEGSLQFYLFTFAPLCEAPHQMVDRSLIDPQDCFPQFAFEFGWQVRFWRPSPILVSVFCGWFAPAARLSLFAPCAFVPFAGFPRLFSGLPSTPLPRFLVIVSQSRDGNHQRPDADREADGEQFKISPCCPGGELESLEVHHDFLWVGGSKRSAGGGTASWIWRHCAQFGPPDAIKTYGSQRLGPGWSPPSDLQLCVAPRVLGG